MFLLTDQGIIVLEMIHDNQSCHNKMINIWAVSCLLLKIRKKLIINCNPTDSYIRLHIFMYTLLTKHHDNCPIQKKKERVCKFSYKLHFNQFILLTSENLND